MHMAFCLFFQLVFLICTKAFSYQTRYVRTLHQNMLYVVHSGYNDLEHKWYNETSSVYCISQMSLMRIYGYISFTSCGYLARVVRMDR